MRIRSLVLAALAVAPAVAARRESPPPAQLDDPCVDGAASSCTRHALDGFRAALDRQRTATPGRPLRVSYFGDSLTADDHITDALRGKLQALVGDGGPGFVFAVPPHPYCQHLAVARVVSDGWSVRGVSTIMPPDRLLGLGGSAETAEAGTITFTATAAVEAIDLHYLAQPHGGRLDVAADGKVIATTATAADHKQGAFATIAVPAGAKRLELCAIGRVRLFGASLENHGGAVVDNLGVVNATAKAMHDHNLDEHWRNQLAHRAPDLVVVMYGANEAEWLHARGAGMAEHEKLFGELLATVRAANPQASCLVVSPLDQLDYTAEAMPPRDSIPAMVEAQRRAAREHGCAFWDTYAWMGGNGSSRAWNQHGLMMTDYQHPTSEGAERIADALFHGLVDSAKL